MKHPRVRWAVIVALVSASVISAVAAQEAQQTEPAKILPTLLIKGEVVSLDTNDPTATLLKVKDRYGFETPIYLTSETQISQADQALDVASLATGTAVEVEYNFDINTAKRHAVSVKLSAPAAGSTASAPAQEAPVAASPVSEAAPAAAAQAAPASEATPAAPAAAPATQEHPGQEHPGQTTP